MMEEESSFVYFKPKSGPCVKVCVTGRGAVYRCNQHLTKLLHNCILNRFAEPNKKENLMTEKEKYESNMSGKVVSLYTQVFLHRSQT